MATGDLTTLQDVKLWIPVNGSSDDALLTALVSRASAIVQTYINRTIASANYTETRNGNGKTVLQCLNTPVSAVASVTVDGVAIPARTSPTGAGFTFDDLMIYLDGAAFASPTVAWGGYVFTRGFQNVVLAYTAGYQTVPSDLADAAIELVSLMYRERDRIGLSSQSLQGQTTAYLIRQLPVRTQMTLDQWRRPPRAEM